MSTSESMEKRLRDWLETQGYPLEMLVSIAFQRRGFRTIQSEYYTDPESNVVREIDVVSHRQRRIQNTYFRVSFVIECKLSRDKPWVLFTSREAHMAEPARVVQRAASTLGLHLLRKLANRKDVQDHPIFQIGERPGYGLTQAFTSGQDITYAAATSVAKAAVAKKIDSDEATRVQFPLCEIVFPVIVVDGRLFECYLDNGTEMNLVEISSGILSWRNPLVGMPHTIIHLVTLPALDDYVSDALSCTDLLLTTCDVELADLAAEEKLNESVRNLKNEGKAGSQQKMA